MLATFKHITRIKSDVAAILKLFFLLAFVAFLTYSSSFKMNGRNYHWDALENAVASYHLWSSGTISLDGMSPSRFREPLPIALGAVYINSFTDVPKNLNHDKWLSTFQDGERISQMEVRYPADFLGSQTLRKQLSYINLIYIALSMIAIYWLCMTLRQSFIFSIIAIFLSWLFYFNSAYFLYRPMTEYITSLLLISLSGAMVLSVNANNLRYGFITGLLSGLLGITKAISVYISIAVIPMVALFVYLSRQVSSRDIAKYLVFFSLGFSIVIAPWKLRNHHHFGDSAITERGGLVLLTRAFKNQMTDDEYKGAFYVYAPVELKKSSWFRSVLGLNESNVIGQKFERLYRSRPGDAEAAENGDVMRASSYFHKAAAHSKRIYLDGYSDVEARLIKHAKTLIISHPINHLKTIPLFAWRGIWSFGHPDPIQPTTGGWYYAILNLLSFLSLLLMPLIAIKLKKIDLLAFSIIGSTTFIFYALTTHFVPRYSASLIPIAIISMLLLLTYLMKKRFAKSAC